MARQYAIGGPLGIGYVINAEDRDFSLPHGFVEGGPGSPLPKADAWNRYDKSPLGITLSDSDKTATFSHANERGIRSTTKYSSGTAGKYYAELLLTTVKVGDAYGIQDVSGDQGGLATATASAIYSDGSIYHIDSTVGDIGSAFSNGDVVCIAWDAGAEKIWFRKNGGSWNGSGTASPATGTEGVDTSTAANVDHALFQYYSASGTAVTTIRTEAAEFGYSGPAGFTSWMGEALGPAGYTLPAAAGSYAVTGAAASLERGREVEALAGAYALTGTAATLTKGAAVTHYNMPAAAGSYALGGATAGLYRGREVLAIAGSYGLSGATISLEVGREVAADPGSYAFSGAIASLELGKEVLALGGTYAITGTTATLRHGWKIAADGSSYALAGQTASLEYGREVLALGGSHALTGTAATFRRTWTATAVSGTYALTGTPVNLLTVGARAIIGLPGSYALTGATVSLETSREVLALGGSYALTGATASLERGYKALASNGSYAVSGATASFIHNRRMAADAGLYGLSGSDATLAYTGTEAFPVYRSIASTTYASRTDSTVCDLPSGAVDGDILIAGIFAGKLGDHISYAAEIEVVPPAGWTQIGTDTEVMDGAFIGTFQVYWKRASGEPSSYTFAHTGATTTYSTQGVIAAYSGCIATGNPVEQFSQTAASIGATATATSVTPQYTHSKLVYLGHNWDATEALTAPAGTTERFDSLVYLSDEDRPGSGMTGARSQSLASNNPWAAFLIDLRSATGILARALGVDQPGLYTLAGASVAFEKSTAGILTARPGSYAISGAPAIIGSGLILGSGSYTITGSPAHLSETVPFAWEITAEAGSYTLTGSPVTLVWSGEVVVTPPGGGGTPYWGPSGGRIPKKQLKRAVKELLERQREAEKPVKPKKVAAELLAAIEPKGLGIREQRRLISLIAEGLRLELPSLFYSQPIIHDREPLMRAILTVMQRALDQIAADEEEDEEAALLLLSA